MSELLKLLFEPPVMILSALGVMGLSLLLRDRDDHRLRVNMEWRVRESWMRDWGADAELIERSRERHYQRNHLKLPKVKK